MASGESGDAVAVHPQHGEKSTSSSMSISTAEPIETIDTTNVNENTKNSPTTSDRFTKYILCYESWLEMAFFKWIFSFQLECHKLSFQVNTELYFGLLNLFCQITAQKIIAYRNNINESDIFKKYVKKIMTFFMGLYTTIKKDKGDTLDVIYYGGMSLMLANYIDLILVSNQYCEENPSDIKTSNEIKTMLFFFLDEKIDYMFDSVFKSYYLFNSKVITNIESIMLPVCKQLISEHPMPQKNNFLTYMRYILFFKLWEKLIHSSGMNDSVKREELDILKLFLSQLNVPNDFMSQYEKYNWPNWPKLTMCSNEDQYLIQRDIKNISFVLYDANLSLKKCYKDISDAAPIKDIPILLQPILEQCKISRPDLFAISKKELLKNWTENFDNNLKSLPRKSLISRRRLKRKIKYNLVPINDEGSENHSLPNIDNFSHTDKKSMEKTNLINSSTNKIIDESNNDPSNEREKSIDDSLKTFIATLESFPANLKEQSSEDEMQVNVKKSKSSKKHDDGRFDPTLSNNPSRLNYISEIINTSHHPECSNSKGQKRNQCSPFGDNSKNKKNGRTKSMHEKSSINCNPNQIIESNCLNSNIGNISCVTLNNNNCVLENPKNSHNINGVSCLTNEPSAKEKKWVTKASDPKLSITAVLNLIDTQSNFTVRDESVENSTKMIDSSINQDGTASPSSDIQLPINLSQSGPYSQDFKRNSNVSYKYTADGLNQKLSPNETGLSRINKSNLIQPNQQFQDLSNFIAPDSPTIQSGSDKKTQIQSRAVHSFECISITEPTEHQETYRNAIIPSQSNESSTSLISVELLSAYNLFIDGKLLLCIDPKCTNSHHFHVSLSEAEILRHKFTVQFDNYRYNIQFMYRKLFILNPRTSWSNIPELRQLTERCLCKDCVEFDSTLNLNQKTLSAYYTEGKNPSIEEDNCENKQPINRKISLKYKKRLAQRYITENSLEIDSISQITDHMETHIKHFKYATQLFQQRCIEKTYEIQTQQREED